MMLSSLQQQEWFAELKQNKRLQWMLLLVFVILLLSLSKTFSDFVNDEKTAIEPQRQLIKKLLQADARPLEELDIESVTSQAQSLLTQVPVATSKSVAEAQALTQVEALSSDYVQNGRATLVNTVDLNFGQQGFWQVRIEVRGKLDERELIGFLEQFSGQFMHQRIASMQYRPKASNTFTVVLDYLFQKGNREQ